MSAYLSECRKMNKTQKMARKQRSIKPWLLIIGLLTIVLLLAGCPKKETPDGGRVTMSSRPVPRTADTATPVVTFNGERAMQHTRKQVEIGPRPSGSEELAKTREYMVSQLKSFGLSVNTEEFNAATPVGEKKMVNLTAEVPGESREVIIIASHYETKLYKDMQFVGANDPASSVGTLLEIGRVLGSKPQPPLTYWLVFFDGEEAFCENWDDCGTPEAPDNTYGSRHYVSKLSERGELTRIRGMILLDLMGYKKLELGRDDMSTRWLQDIIWMAGKELGHGSIFVDREEGVGGDDHEPFLKAGVDAVDIIQLNSYPHWHKPTDTLDKISARSMKIVADVVLASLPRIEEKILGKGSKE